MRVGVIGSGILGQAVTRRLREGGAEVELVGPLGAGEGSASLAAGAMLGALGEVVVAPPTFAARQELALRVEAQRRYPAWLSSLGGRVPVGSGTFVIAAASGARDLENLAEIERVAGQEGLACERVEPRDVPWLRPASHEPTVRALYLAEEGFVDADHLLADLTTMNQTDSGVTWTVGLASRIDRAGARCAIEVEGRLIECDHVVVAAGQGTAALVGTDDGLPPLVGGKGVSMTFRSGANAAAGPPAVIRTPNREFACGTHVVPRGDGWYLGATNRIATTPGATAKVTGGEVHSLLHSGIHEINVGMRVAEVDGVRYGTRPVTSDHYPLVGLVASSLTVATGTYRNGILMAPVIADWVAHAVFEGGDHADNAFAPAKRAALLEDAPPSAEEALIAGARELVGFAVSPFGELPYDRYRELTIVVSELARLAAGDSAGTQRDRAALRERVAELPMAEVMVEIFYQLADEAAADGS